jgi:hypothetical protein
MTALVLAGQCATMLAPATALGASPASQAQAGVQTGQSYYEHARFDDAIALLRGLVDGGQLHGSSLLKAREFLARSLAKKGLAEESIRVFKAMLSTDPKWRPDLNLVPPDESSVFDQALKEFTAETAAGTAKPPATAPGSAADTTGAPATTPAVTEPAPAEAPSRPDMKSAQLGNADAGAGGKKSSKKLWYVLGGAAVAGTAVALAGGGKKGGSESAKPLAGFPGAP